MKLIINLICILTIVTTSFAADEWLNYSSPFPIKAAVPYGDGLLLATGGGVRYRTNTSDDIYTTSNGLGDQLVSAIALSNDYGTFAVSDNGVISLAGAGGRWQILSHSYAGNNTHVVPGLVQFGGPVMVIAFDDRLSFFSVKTSTSIMTIERIMNSNLSANPITALSVRDDSLYVVAGGSVYVRKMDWEKLESDLQLSNPDSWKLVKKASGDGETIKSIAWKNGKLQTFLTDGTWLWDKDGETHVSIDTFSVFSASNAACVVVRGKLLKDSILYERDSVVKSVQDKKVSERYYYRSKVRWVSLLSSGRAVLAGPNDVFYYDGKKVSDLTEYRRFPLTSVYELQALPSGGVLAASEEGKFSCNFGSDWTESKNAVPAGIGNSGDGRIHNMKVLSVQPNGSAFYHIWGVGYFLYSEWGYHLDHAFMSDGGHCLDTYLDFTPYSIAISSTPAPGNSGFLSTSASYKGHYSLVYFSANGDISCANNIGSSPIGGPMLAKVDEKGNWVVYVGTRSGPSIDADGGLDVITLAPPNKRGGELVVDSGAVKTYYGTTSTPLDLVYEPKTEYLWMITSSTLAYWNPDQDSLRSPLSTNGLTGSGFTSIDVDSRGNLWVGTSTQGAFRLTPRPTNPDTLSVLHYTTRQGLLSNTVQDVAVDSALGLVWFAHETGVTRYRRNDLRGTEGNMTEEASASVKVYPNPFRPKIQAYVIFDNISDDAVIGIYNRGGRLVTSLSGSDVVGGRAEWDGKMKNGNLVAPGVYQYVIRGGSTTKKGKLLIIH